MNSPQATTKLTDGNPEPRRSSVVAVVVGTALIVSSIALLFLPAAGAAQVAASFSGVLAAFGLGILTRFDPNR